MEILDLTLEDWQQHIQVALSVSRLVLLKHVERVGSEGHRERCTWIDCDGSVQVDKVGVQIRLYSFD